MNQLLRQIQSQMSVDPSTATFHGKRFDSAHDALRDALQLPFYLYDGPEFDDGSWFEPCSIGLGRIKVRDDQYSGEYYFLRQLRQHPWRTQDASRALLYVVPTYLNAALQPAMKGLSCNGTHHQRLLDRTAAAVAATPQYQRGMGVDHVLLCNSWRSALSAPKMAPWAAEQVSTEFFRHTFRNAVMGHMEIRHPADVGFWRCSVVAPYVPNFDEASTLKLERSVGAAGAPATSARRGSGARHLHRADGGGVAAAAAHLRPPSERDVSFYFQGAANNRGSFGYAFRQAHIA